MAPTYRPHMNQPPAPSASPSALVDQHIAYVEKLVDHGGPAPSEYDSFRLWLQQVAREHRSGMLSNDELDRLRYAFGEALTPRTLQGFSYTKPHGHAGDFEIIDRLYTKYITDDPDLKKWDLFFQAQRAPEAVRNRKTYFLELVTCLRKAFPGKTSLPVLNVASGPARDVFEFFDTCEQDHAVCFDCVDNDANAVDYAEELCAPYLDRICFQEANALRFRPRRDYQLVWSAGLFDYLSDKGFTFLLKRMIGSLRDDGELVIGNFSPRNPTRDYMEIIGGWHLHHRSKDKLVELATSCGVAEEDVRVGSEPEGINLFLHVKRGKCFLPVHSLQE
jgi:hypothetical protein